MGMIFNNQFQCLVRDGAVVNGKLLQLGKPTQTPNKFVVNRIHHIKSQLLQPRAAKKQLNEHVYGNVAQGQLQFVQTGQVPRNIHDILRHLNVPQTQTAQRFQTSLENV
uniref:(northern house mosquito) hypothetical protein n=1 Tax=Culex pipiens TaxID=7175 RepID=A0A8D8DAX8_CULPI